MRVVVYFGELDQQATVNSLAPGATTSGLREARQRDRQGSGGQDERVRDPSAPQTKPTI